MEKKEIFHTRTFEKISPEKQKVILGAAKTEFAARGYQAANINVIAEKAGISVGGLYRYFRTKENLFLSVIETGLEVLSRFLKEAVQDGGCLYGNIKKTLRAAHRYSLEDPEMIRMYIDCTGENLTDMAKRLSRRMESLSAETYASWIAEARKRHEVHPSVDERIAAFFLDNIFLVFQFSFASEYYHERMKIFTGRDDDQVEQLIEGLISLIRFGLEGEGTGSGTEPGQEKSFP